MSCSWSYQRHPDSRMQQEQTCKPRGQTAASRRPLLTSANSLRASTSAAVCTAARRRADSINARSTPAIPGSSAVSPRRRLPARASGWSCGDTEAEPVDTLDDVERLGLRRASGATDNHSAPSQQRHLPGSTLAAPASHQCLLPTPWHGEVGLREPHSLPPLAQQCHPHYGRPHQRPSAQQHRLVVCPAGSQPVATTYRAPTSKQG